MAGILGPTKRLTIGRSELLLPYNHALEQYQAAWPRYDRSLGEIANIIWAKYPGFCAIDIGANVGDTAALLCNAHDIRTLCVEGHPAFLEYLAINAPRIGPHVVIEPSFIGAADSSSYLHAEENARGTAKLVASSEPTPGHALVTTKTMQTVLAEHPDFEACRLLKIDTDGFDFQIISSSFETIQRIHPIVFSEYIPFEQSQSVAEGIGTIQTLASAGYAKIIIYHNLGHYIVSLDADDTDHIVDVNAFLCSNHTYGRAVSYFDVCAFPEDELDLFADVRRSELARLAELP